jgi:hypothetical protein
MIKLSNQVPSIYINASRDFQYLSWLIDIVLNSVKHNVDDIYNLPNNQADPKLTELLAMTLGFKVKRNYDQSQLRALVAALPRILKYKGTKNAIDMAGKALIAASGASGDFRSEISGGELTVTFPIDLVDISLFTDFLNYILPAGMTCRIVRENLAERPYATELAYNEILIADWKPDLAWDETTQTTIGLANMFNVNTYRPTLANYVDEDVNLLNVGLLDNSIIPTLEEPLYNSEGNTLQNDYDTAVMIDKFAEAPAGEIDDTTVIINEE